ncbi:MAG: response regulator transcription factor [Acidobacteriota bacterium]
MNQLRVVVADDQALMREGLVQLLRLLGDIDVVAVAADGEEALQQIRELSPAVALLDVRMPKLTGLQVLQRLRQEEHPCAVILLTTFDDDEVLLRAIKAGARGYLLKDTRHEQLGAAIRAVATGGSVIRPAITERAIGNLQAADVDSPTESLTRRETQVLRLMAGGYSNRQIADALGASEGTIKNHATNIFQKLGVGDRTRAVLKAIELGYL